uniref:Uncharacterized protein n=1 Tax=Varanus komodoensis TaxID=61221 RepID=A0A8D2IK17_VARKO
LAGMVAQRMINNVYWLYWQFQLITLTYLMDPFEWWLFHSCLLVTCMVSAYVFYAFVPPNIHLVLENVRHLFGLQSESTISTMM